MVPERPPLNDPVWNGEQLCSGHPQINSAQLSSFASGSGALLLSGARCVHKQNSGPPRTQAYRSGGVPFHRKRSIYALGGWSRSSMMPEAGALDAADETCREYESGRPNVSRSNPDRSETVFHEAPVTPVQSCGVRDKTFQKRKKYNQTAYSAKADKAIHDLQNKKLKS